MVGMHTVCTSVLLAVVLIPFAGAAERGPVLDWIPKSDWRNVKTDFALKASGDGMADDTAALQVALDALSARGGFQGGGVRLHGLGNVWVGDPASPKHTPDTIKDTPSPETTRLIQSAMDDLRRLGAIEIKLLRYPPRKPHGDGRAGWYLTAHSGIVN